MRHLVGALTAKSEDPFGLVVTIIEGGCKSGTWGKKSITEIVLSSASLSLDNVANVLICRWNRGPSAPSFHWVAGTASAVCKV